MSVSECGTKTLVEPCSRRSKEIEGHINIKAVSIPFLFLRVLTFWLSIHVR